MTDTPTGAYSGYAHTGRLTEAGSLERVPPDPSARCWECGGAAVEISRDNGDRLDYWCHTLPGHAGKDMSRMP